MNLDHHMAHLKELIGSRAIKKGEFLLSSGKISNYYLDLKAVVTSADGVHVIGPIMSNLANYFNCHSIGGMESGAIPISTAAVAFSSPYNLQRALSSFWIRKATRDHGIPSRIVGDVRIGGRVMVVEDVTTTGTSLFEACKVCIDNHLTVVKAVTIVDRLDPDSEDLKRTFNFQSLFTIKDFGL